MRVFTAVTFEASTVRYLQSASESISSIYEHAKLTRSENFHLTIVFIGEANRDKVNSIISAAKETAMEMKAFNAITDGISSFRKRNSHTVYCRIKESEQLLELHDKMMENLRGKGIALENVKYKPHVTLARQAGLMGNRSELRLPFHTFEVNNICVMESSRINGILTYAPLVKFKLGEMQ